MKLATLELIGWRLDQAVAKASGYGYDMARSSMVVLDLATNNQTVEEGCTIIRDGTLMRYSPSTNWDHGGPIIERERISVEWDHRSTTCTEWGADVVHDSRDDGVGRTWAVGPTALIAAMRAFVSSRLGDEIDL